MTKNTLYQILAVTLVAVLLLYMESSQNILGPTEDVQDKPSIYPYAVADNAATQYYSEDGILDYTFNAKQLKYFSGRDVTRAGEESGSTVLEYTLLEEPKFVIYLADRSWYIQSRKGKITERGNTITLWDQVKVWRDGQDDSKTELDTESLKILPHEKFAETHEAVRIRSSGSELTAVGMQVSFADKKIKFLSRVKERYEPR